MNPNQFIKWDIECYKEKIKKLENQIKQITKTKEMWEDRLRRKERELKLE